MRNITKTKRQQNQGFSLFTVLIAVSFVGILGLLVLYIALSNFNMKITDLKGKDSFYTAERALEEIRTGLQEDVGNAMSKAYTQVLESYNVENRSQDSSMDRQRQSEFQDCFITELMRTLRVSKTEDNIYNMERLRGYVDLEYDESKESLIITNPAGSAPLMKAVKNVGKNTENNGVLLKNLKVIYVDEKGRASIICTDIRLLVPEVQFPTPSTLPDLMNMIVVADKGIVCEGSESTPTSINGSIYAGNLPSALAADSETSIKVIPGASLNVESGDKVVCKGEISVGLNSTFTSAGSVNLWARGLNADSVQNVSLSGSTYFADDLTVTGKNNNVKISGNYYGYGSYESATSDDCVAKDQYEKSGLTGAALSSAIVINGKNTTLDLSDTQKLMIAGRNYIASSKVKANNRSNTNDVATGESLTVKGTQLAYLVPKEVLGASGNPLTYDAYLSLLNGAEDISVNWDAAVEAWGGRTLRDIGVDSEKPVQTVFYNDGFVYFYLNFTDAQKSADFMQMYYQNNPTVKANMDKYLSFYFGGEDSGITVKDADSYLRYITNGNALSYSGADAQGNMQQATSVNPGEKILQEQVGYQNSWYALNRKMITSYDLLNKAVKEDGEGKTHDETDGDRSVYDNLVNEKKMIDYIDDNVMDSTKKYVFTASVEDGGLTAIMYDNGESGVNQTLKISQSDADKLRLVVCTGDVEIEAGVKFQGIIMAKGTITLRAGAQLESAPLEAARVFQAQMRSYGDGTSIKPQDFFWEGDKYVLGNSASSGKKDTLNGSDTYSIVDCVSYENWKKE
ncbi:type IV pilus modification PilV family protein [Blautia sp.]|uniref:type IV pilus modification PilV family protein n=1 Tax=Blautia sp. TaxID=1955243 RepID=UPI003AB4497E